MQKNLFIGFKASRAIPIHNTLTRDLLIQSTLDGDVRRIEYQNSVIMDERIVSAYGIIVERFDGRYAVDIVDARPANDPSSEALVQLAFARKCHGVIELRSADIRTEPHCSAAREVWSHRTVRMHPDDRAEILETLEREGPVGLGQLIGSVATRGDARALIFALASEGAVELDLRGGITYDLIVRPGHTVFAAGLRANGA
ncbi:hypothetical protein [Bradyrhizobium sp. F1.13.3]|uniref:hypothetical protein n=1 Tax=Bradyrhizobium sp. F1.13.3 TaxID=3156351 RepID=UPI00339A4CFC